jgi:hypothetical protein
MKILHLGLLASIRADCIENNTREVAANGDCICHEGITGDRCQHIDYDLECDQSFVTVRAPMATFERIGITDASRLRLNDPNCRGVETTEDGVKFVKFTITGSPAECGAEVTSNGTYIRYKNTVRDNDVTNDPSMTTRSQVEIGFRCDFPVDYRVALPAIMPTVSTVAVQTSRGKFVVSMDMFQGDDFQEKLDLTNNQVSIAKGEWLHLEMNLRTVVDDVSSNLIAEQCWATPVAQPHSQAPDERELYHNILMVCGTQLLIIKFYSISFRTAAQLTHRSKSSQTAKTTKSDSKFKCLDSKEKITELSGFTASSVSAVTTATRSVTMVLENDQLTMKIFQLRTLTSRSSLPLNF